MSINSSSDEGGGDGGQEADLSVIEHIDDAKLAQVFNKLESRKILLIKKNKGKMVGSMNGWGLDV